jgi:hypothetical protein
MYRGVQNTRLNLGVKLVRYSTYSFREDTDGLVDPQQIFAEVELRSIPPPMYPGGWIQVAAPQHQVRAGQYDPQTQFLAPEDALVANGNAYAYTPAVGTDGSVELPILYASDMSMMPNATMSWNEDFYLQFPDGNEETFTFGADPNGPLVPMEAMVTGSSSFGTSGLFASRR